MSTKIIQDAIPKLLNSQFAVLVLVGLGVWSVSKMSSQQIDTLEHVALALANPVGVFMGVLGSALLLYALFFYPVGKFLSGIITKYTDIQIAHHNATAEHHNASKQMAAQIDEVRESTREIRETLTDTVVPGIDALKGLYGRRN